MYKKLEKHNGDMAPVANPGSAAETSFSPPRKSNMQAGL
jgi:hypothetical protein